MDFDTVRVNNCASVKNRTGRHLIVFPVQSWLGLGKQQSNAASAYFSTTVELGFKHMCLSDH